LFRMTVVLASMGGSLGERIHCARATGFGPVALA
jgi:hypothetical protein